MHMNVAFHDRIKQEQCLREKAQLVHLSKKLSEKRKKERKELSFRSEKMTGIFSIIPKPVTKMILRHAVIGGGKKDLLSLSAVCRACYEMCKSDEFWRVVLPESLGYEQDLREKWLYGTLMWECILKLEDLPEKMKREEGKRKMDGYYYSCENEFREKMCSIFGDLKLEKENFLAKLCFHLEKETIEEKIVEGVRLSDCGDHFTIEFTKKELFLPSPLVEKRFEESKFPLLKIPFQKRYDLSFCLSHFVSDEVHFPSSFFFIWNNDSPKKKHKFCEEGSTSLQLVPVFQKLGGMPFLGYFGENSSPSEEEANRRGFESACRETFSNFLFSFRQEQSWKVVV